MEQTITLELPDNVDLPLKVDEDGNVRVSGTRVTLYTIINNHKMGGTPETIHQAFDTVPLADVYIVLGYYYANQDAVDEYIRQMNAIGDYWREVFEARYTPEQKARHERLRQLALEKRKQHQE